MNITREKQGDWTMLVVDVFFSLSKTHVSVYLQGELVIYLNRNSKNIMVCVLYI